MTHVLEARPLTAAAFAGYGDVIEVSGTPTTLINDGTCGRYNDLARLDFGDGRAGISLFDAAARHLPHEVKMVERHPQGSQAFIPITPVPFLVVVAEDDNGTPKGLRAFLAASVQSVNLHRGVWHGVLCPVGAPGLFAVIDRIGEGTNLEEFRFDTTYVVDSISD